MMETYESVRYRILRFDEMPPKEREEVYRLVWGLRQLVSDNKDALPKPGAALLHDSLSHAVLVFIGIYEREWERGSGDATPEQAQLEDVARRRRNIIENTERISA